MGAGPSELSTTERPRSAEVQMQTTTAVPIALHGSKYQFGLH